MNISIKVSKLFLWLNHFQIFFLGLLKSATTWLSNNQMYNFNNNNLNLILNQFQTLFSLVILNFALSFFTI